MITKTAYSLLKQAGIKDILKGGVRSVSRKTGLGSAIKKIKEVKSRSHPPTGIIQKLRHGTEPVNRKKLNKVLPKMRDWNPKRGISSFENKARQGRLR